MPSLFDQRNLDALIGIADGHVNGARERLRAVMYADGPNSAPPGFENLDSPEKVRTFSRFISRQANREVHKTVPGNLNETIAQHPAVRQMAEDAGATMEPTPEQQPMDGV